LSEALKTLAASTDDELRVFKALLDSHEPKVPQGFDPSISVKSLTSLVDLVRSGREAKRTQWEKWIDRGLTVIGTVVTSALVIAGWFVAKH
jgi:hypothetical protein